MDSQKRYFNPGDKVLVLDEDLMGFVLSTNGTSVVVTTDDDFEIEFDSSELVLMDNKISKRDFIPDNVSDILSVKAEDKIKKTNRVKPKERKLPAMEVDLHIHQLVPKNKGMNNYDMLTIQIDTAKRQLEFAMKKKIQRIVFIHGVGEGVLKTELEYLFRQYGNLQFNDANFQKYGRGATEVYIFQNKER